MNLTTQTEFLRILDDQPLTLSCSALADFLWTDFVRDARPSVKYLINVHNIRQLSRFGKELFDRLYNADNVHWLVSEQDYEQYFRDVCNGNSVTVPNNYKPENGIWYSIMADLSQSAGWLELLKRSVGDQFNAGNNAVNILNLLSEVIEKAIESSSFDVTLLTGSGEELEKLRQEFKEAQATGNQQGMAEARGKGKQLNQKINEAIESAKQVINPQSHRIVDSVIKQHDQTNEAISNLAGNTAGTGKSVMNLEEKKELAKKLKSNKELRYLMKKIGTLKRIWAERKKAKAHKATYESIVGAEFSDDITRVFPTELALAGTKQGKALFALKYSQKTLLTKDYNAHQKDLGKGPIILYVDVSGSMGGEPELWSKAITFVIAEHALNENRQIDIHLFDTRIDGSVSLQKGRKTNKELLDFVGSWILGGGTSFNAVLAHALDKSNLGKNSDVLMITDGHAEVNENFLKRLKALKDKTGMQWNTICINSSVPPVCKLFSEEVYSVNVSNQSGCVDAIQKCLR